MPAARYWRAVGLQSVGGGALELSALHLYLGGARVDAAATRTSTVAPASGSLAALQDADTATTARWLDVSAPGFALVWDFGAGNTQDVGAVRLGSGAAYAEWLEPLTLQYSSDGVVWTTLGSIPAFSWPGANTLQDAPVGVGDTAGQRKLGVKQSGLPILLSGGSAGDTVMTLPPATIHLDLQDANGTETQPSTTRYRIPGPRWVKEKTASTNVPLRRRVQLYNQRDSRLVREVWSDPVTGEYSFDNIRGDATYFVIAFDHTGHYRAVIADNLTPEPIP